MLLAAVVLVPSRGLASSAQHHGRLVAAYACEVVFVCVMDVVCWLPVRSCSGVYVAGSCVPGPESAYVGAAMRGWPARHSTVWDW